MVSSNPNDLARRMIATVGDSPLPVYAGVLQFLRKGGELALVGTAGTRQDGERIVRQLADSRPDVATTWHEVPHQDLNKALSGMEQALSGADPKTALVNLTGGTKVMSAAAAVAAERVGLFERLMYLDYSDDSWYRNGESVPLKPDLLSIKAVVQIHNYHLEPKNKKPLPVRLLMPMLEYACRAAETKSSDPCMLRVREAVQLSNRGSESKRKRVRKEYLEDADCGYRALVERVYPSGLAEEFDRALGPDPDSSGWIKWLDGMWLEDLVETVVAELTDADGVPLFPTGNYASGMSNDRMEVDLVALRGSQLRVLSVTSSCQPRIVKGKGFEVITRAEQFGGTRARPGLVSLLTDDQSASLSENLRRDKPQARGFKVFGRDDVMGWAHGDPERLGKLRNWMVG